MEAQLIADEVTNALQLAGTFFSIGVLAGVSSGSSILRSTLRSLVSKLVSRLVARPLR